MRFLIIFSLVILTLFSSFVLAEDRPADFGKQWVRNNPFTISGLMQRPQMLDANEYTDCGFSSLLIWKAREQFFEKAVKAGLTWQGHLIRKPARKEPIGAFDDPFTDEVKELAKRLYNTYPGCIGWSLWDEPYRAQLLKLREAIEWFKHNFPDTLIYTNAYPPKEPSNNNGKCYGGKWLGPDLYEEPPIPYSFYHYMRDIAEVAKPDILCFDIYPFRLDADEDEYIFQRYFTGLAAVRKVAIENNMPYWLFVQSFSKENYTRLPNEVDMRMQVFSSLAYGFTGIMYFTYDSLFPDGSTLLKEGSGEPTELYYKAAQINKEVANIGKSLRFLTSTAVAYIPGQSRDDDFEVITNKLPLEAKAFKPEMCKKVRQIKIIDSNADKNALVGFFTDDSGGIYFMPVNLRYGEGLEPGTTAIEMEIKFAPDVKKVSRISRKTGKPEVLNLTNNSLKLELLGGTGDLFKIENSDFPGMIN